jgi:uncharacterized metal-binding protein YceD (DUF177 family)
MPEIRHSSATNPEFARVVDVAALRGLEEFPFELTATETELRAMARLLDVRSLRRFRFVGALRPVGQGGWRLDGRLGVTGVQTCVVTLEPVTTRLDLDITRTFLPAAGETAAEITLSPLDDEEDVEPLGTQIDLGIVAIEAMALSLPAYPRAPGAELREASYSSPGTASTGEEEAKPFAALSALRDKLSEGH